jgi:arabinan endo-1,5-alpha-L-arabinosidase
MLVGIALLLALSTTLGVTWLSPSPVEARSSQSYDNPVLARITDDDDEGDEGVGNDQVGVVESCADPSIIHSAPPQGDGAWYMYCTTDPLNDQDPTFNLIPILRSFDLIEWEYVGNAFAARPVWAGATAGLWAPDINYFNNQYYLYYAVSATAVSQDSAQGSAIGVATAPTPIGPWTHHATPVVEPQVNPYCCGENVRRHVFDPDVLEWEGKRYIYFGSYFGGIAVRELSPDGLSTSPATHSEVTTANKYEGAHVVPRDGFLYMFVSATDCCRGPLTGYSVFAGRADNPRGPFRDKEGATLMESHTGGTPVISMNGNKWIGPGHNYVFTDFDGQDWTVYHAVDRTDPYFASHPTITKRPAMLDALDWVDGWPTVRGGLWASETQQPAPAAQPGTFTTYKPNVARYDEPGPLLEDYSDEFDDGVLSPQWQWVRPPAPVAQWNEERGHFRFNTQPRDLHEAQNSAPVLIEEAPPGDYMVEARLRFTGDCCVFQQAGLVIYRDDDSYIKLVHVVIFETRQTEFAKEHLTPAGPRYGNTVVGPPAASPEYTYLRIVKRNVGNVEYYRAYTSRDLNGDGEPDEWQRGGVWTHELGQTTSNIGLVSMGGPEGAIAEFDYVRTFRVIPGEPAGKPT